MLWFLLLFNLEGWNSQLLLLASCNCCWSTVSGSLTNMKRKDVPEESNIFFLVSFWDNICCRTS